MNNHNDFEKLDIPLLVKIFDIYQSAHRLIYTLPKFERYSLGEKIENAVLVAIEYVAIANTVSKYEKEQYLIRVNGKIELVKLLYRLALDCQLIEQNEYLATQADLQVAGKMTQGWIKYARAMK